MRSKTGRSSVVYSARGAGAAQSRAAMPPRIHTNVAGIDTAYATRNTCYMQEDILHVLLWTKLFVKHYEFQK